MLGVIGDGELDEGSNYEAFNLIDRLRIENIIVLVDINNLTQMMKKNSLMINRDIRKTLRVFGMEYYECDGHDSIELTKAISRARNSVRSTIIACDTTKGKGLSFMEDEAVWHYRTLANTDYDNAVKELTK